MNSVHIEEEEDGQGEEQESQGIIIRQAQAIRNEASAGVAAEPPPGGDTTSQHPTAVVTHVSIAAPKHRRIMDDDDDDDSCAVDVTLSDTSSLSLLVVVEKDDDDETVPSSSRQLEEVQRPLRHLRLPRRHITRIDDPVVMERIHDLCRTGDAEQLATLVHAISIDWKTATEIACAAWQANVMRVLVKRAKEEDETNDDDDDDEWCNFFTEMLVSSLDNCTFISYGDIEEELTAENNENAIVADDGYDAEACRREAAVIEFLLQQGADGTSFMQGTCRTPLHLALGANRIDLIKCLVTVGGVNVNASTERDREGYWALETACANSHLNVCKFLDNECGAVVNHYNEHDDSTPLIHAAQWDDWSIVKWLILHAHADPHLASEEQRLLPLFGACRDGENETVRILIEQAGYDVNLCDEDGDTPLHYFADLHDYEPDSVCAPDHFNRVETAKFLLEAGADVNAQNSRGKTPLHNICECYSSGLFRLDLIRYFVLKAGADPGIPDHHGKTALYYALTRCRAADALRIFHEHCPDLVKSFDANQLHDHVSGKSVLLQAVSVNDTDLVTSLLQKTNASMDARHSDGRLPVHMATTVEMLNLLIETGGADVHDIDRKIGPGRSLLHYACSERQSVAVVANLIHNLGAVVDLQDERGNTPLHRACKHGRLDAARCLILGGGSNPSIADSKGRTPLHRASTEGKFSIVSFLLEQNASRKYKDSGERIIHSVDVNAQDNDGNTALHMSCKEGDVATVLILLEQGGASLTITDNYGRLPLHRACEGGHIDVVIFLITKGKFNVNTQDDNLETPIWVASRNGEVDMVEWLCENAGADLNICDKHGDHPLHIACRKGHLDLVEWIVRHKLVSVDLRNKYGETPLHYACHSGQRAIASFLIIDCGASVSICDDKGAYPLHAMFDQCPSATMARLLVGVGMAPVNVTDRDGNSPLHRAFLKRREAHGMAEEAPLGLDALGVFDNAEEGGERSDVKETSRTGLVEEREDDSAAQEIRVVVDIQQEDDEESIAGEEESEGRADTVSAEEIPADLDNVEEDEEASDNGEEWDFFSGFLALAVAENMLDGDEPDQAVDEEDNDADEGDEEEEDDEGEENDWWSDEDSEASDTSDARDGFLAIASVFLEQDAQISIPNNACDRVLFLACRDDDVDVETLYKMVHLSVSEGLFR